MRRRGHGEGGMSENEPVRLISFPFVGGPWDGQRIDINEGYQPLGDGSHKVVRADIVTTPHPGGSYHRTRHGQAIWYEWRPDET